MTNAANTNASPDLSDTEVQKALEQAKNRKLRAAERASMTPEQRAEAKIKDDQEKAARKAQREKERAEKQAAKGEAPAAHMTKVLRARGNLPALVGAALAAFENLTANLSVLDISNLVANLGQYVREKQTETALKTELEKDQTVRILRGSERFNGQLATVSKTGRIRCYVRPVGHDKDVYLFTSDLELVETLTTAEIDEATAGENEAQESASKVA